MIAKVTRGSGFKGLASYLLSGKDGTERDRVAWIATRHLASESRPDLAAAEMRATASRSARVEKPVYHLAISLDPGEKLERQAFERVVDRTLKDLGLAEHQALLVAHRDTRHPHVHVMVNRVHPETGRAWHAGHDYARIERSLRRQERDLGLRQVPGRHYSLEGQERTRDVRPSSGDRRYVSRTGERPFGEHVREVARTDLRSARSWTELHERLAEVGLRLEKRGRGVVLTDGERRVKASYVDRGSSLGRLEERLGSWEPPPADRFPAGKSERWAEVEGLRRTVSELVRERARVEERERTARGHRLEDRQSDRERGRLVARVRAASRALSRRLDELYRDPRAARREIERVTRSEGSRRTARLLEQRPERFGTLHGRGGPLASADRWAALEEAPRAAQAVHDLGQARKALARHRARFGRPRRGRAPRVTNPALRTVSRVDRTSRRVRALGHLAASQIASRSSDAYQTSFEQKLKVRTSATIEQLGWTFAARVLPPVHYRILRTAYTVGRKTLEALFELERRSPP